MGIFDLKSTGCFSSPVSPEKFPEARGRPILKEPVNLSWRKRTPERTAKIPKACSPNICQSI